MARAFRVRWRASIPPDTKFISGSNLLLSFIFLIAFPRAINFVARKQSMTQVFRILSIIINIYILMSHDIYEIFIGPRTFDLARFINKSRLAMDSDTNLWYLLIRSPLLRARPLLSCKYARIVVITILSTLVRANGPRCKLHEPALRLSPIKVHYSLH